MASNRIYREAAIQRLSRPDSLDAPKTLTLPRVWLGVVAIMAGVIGLAAWAMAASAPVKVTARGLLLPEIGLAEVSVLERGRIATVPIALGDVLTPGDIVATFRRDDREREAAQLSQRVADIAARLDALRAFFEDENAISDAAAAARRAAIEESVGFTERRIELLSERAADVRGLVDRGIMTSDSLIAVELEVAESMERLSRLQNDLRALEIEAAERLREQRRRLLDDQLELDQLSRQLERLRADLSDESSVRSPHGGRVAELRIAAGDVVEAGQSIVTLAPVDADDARTIAVVYVPAVNGRQIEPGMEAELVPSAFERAQFGFLRGTVLSVAPVAATREGILQTVRNPVLVDELTARGAVFEVRVALIADETTPSGLAWSSSDGPSAQVLPGTPLDVEIVIDRRPIADMVIPGVSGALGR